MQLYYFKWSKLRSDLGSDSDFQSVLVQKNKCKNNNVVDLKDALHFLRQQVSVAGL